MKLDACVEEYVTYRRSLGIGFHSGRVHLCAFATAMGDVHVAQVKPGAVRRFLTGVGSTASFRLRKQQTLTGFFRYAMSRGYTSKSPLPTIKPQPEVKFVPYIFSSNDMRALFRAAEERHRKEWLVQPDTARTLLLLLYGTGLRTSEALKLNTDEVDLDDRVLRIRDTKFYKSRLVPVGKDLHRVLLEYRRKHDPRYRRRIRSKARPFLMDRRRRRITLQTAEETFKRMRAHAGVKRPKDSSYQPRLHDLRHTFAVQRLLSWYREGRNVQQLLPHLATYLGHHSVRETQHYLTLTAELWDEASRRFHKYTSEGKSRG